MHLRVAARRFTRTHSEVTKTQSIVSFFCLLVSTFCRVIFIVKSSVVSLMAHCINYRLFVNELFDFYMMAWSCACFMRCLDRRKEAGIFVVITEYRSLRLLCGSVVVYVVEA